jgi:uncharacterized protein
MNRCTFWAACSLCFLALSVLLASCDNDNNAGGDDKSFDRKALLRAYADQLIKPAFQDLKTQTEALDAAIIALNSNVNAQNLSAAQSAWTNALSSWQYTNAYNFGPAGEEGLKKGLSEEIATFPASTSKIESRISQGQWNLNDFDRDARGFLAIEYLIFGEDQNKALSSLSTSNQRRAFLAALSADLRKRVTEAHNAWNGSYTEQFVQNSGTDVGSSTVILYNEFLRSYELLKNFKLSLPLGKRIGQTKAEPQLVEALYSGQSLNMLRLHFAAIEGIWRGKTKAGQDFPGLRSYLQSAVGGPELIASTEAQLSNVQKALAAIPNSPSLSKQITDNKAPLENLNTELQKLTRFFKSDLSSLLGLTITFSSGDGD